MSNIPLLDLTASFTGVLAPTPYGVYDADSTFRSDADGLVVFAYNKLGGRILQVEMTNRDVYTCLEEASLEYSAMVNTYHAKSLLADIIGGPTGSLSGQENRVAQLNLALAKRQADAYSSEALAGGSRTLHSASITIRVDQQAYDLNVLLSQSSIITEGQRVEIREIFHFSPTAAYRFFDTSSAINYLHNQFQFESFTPETVFYLLPIWEDVLRAQQLEMSHRVRRSQTSYSMVNNVLKLFPIPSVGTRLHFTYYLVNETPFDTTDPMYSGIANLSNVPFGNITYANINSMGRQWIRRFAFALAKEVLGQVRSKLTTVPIPNGDLTLNGSELVGQAREEQMILREELKTWLDSMTYDKLALQEAEQADNLIRQLVKVPMGIYFG